MRKAAAMAAIVSALTLVVLLGSAKAAEEHGHPVPMDNTAVALSAGLSALLSEEMLAINEGFGVLVAAMAAGEWTRVAETGERIERSYILAQRLTAEQVEELGRVLPPRFKALDAAFHRSAGKLSQAARERDAELATFHFYKLMEACVECHANYAGTRFPGFDGGEEGDEHH